MSDDDAPVRGPAEDRLEEHLELLRIEGPAAETSLVHRVVRTARWQRAVRTPVQVAASIAWAVIDGLRGLVGGRTGRAR